MENQGQGSLQNTPGRSTDVDISVTGPSTPLWHTPVLYSCTASRFGGMWEFELAKQGQDESPAEALWWASKGLIRWKVPPWKGAKLFLVFHLSFSSECGWQLHCPFASHGLHSVATYSAARNTAQIRNKAIIKTQRKFQRSSIFQLCKTEHAAKTFLFNLLIMQGLLFMWYFQLLWAFWAEVG